MRLLLIVPPDRRYISPSDSINHRFTKTVVSDISIPSWHRPCPGLESTGRRVLTSSYRNQTPQPLSWWWVL